MAVSATTTPNTPNGIMALKKSMDIEQNSVTRILEDSAKQQKQLEQTSEQTRRQAAMITGIGVNLDVMA